MLRKLLSQVWLVAADCFFIGLAPVLVHMAKNADGKYNFHPVAINLMVECAKLVFATATLLVNVSRQLWTMLIVAYCDEEGASGEPPTLAAVDSRRT
jgi:hypothetical protein